MYLFTKISLVVIVTSFVTPIQMPREAREEDAFAHCLKTGQAGSVMACAGLSALNKLQSLEEEQSFHLVDGVSLTRSDQHPRGFSNFLDRDPSDYRNILESFGLVFNQRALHWDMGSLYPGLAMKVGPSLTGDGLLEFELDPIKESYYPLKQASTSRLLARQLLVPFLLGFKFKVATLIPIIFGVLALLAKKAVVVSKLALVITSALGLGGLLLGGQGGGGSIGTQIYGGYGGGGGGYGGGPGHHHQHHSYNRLHPLLFKQDINEELAQNQHDDALYSETLYRGHVNPNPEDKLSLTGRLEDIYPREQKTSTKKTGRNFAWVEAETKQQ